MKIGRLEWIVRQLMSDIPMLVYGLVLLAVAGIVGWVASVEGVYSPWRYIGLVAFLSYVYCGAGLLIIKAAAEARK